MPSHLTLRVFRRILANEPIIHRGCVRRQRYGSVTRTPIRSSRQEGRTALTQAQWQQRRSMFNFNIFRKQQDVTEASMDPGIDEMMQLAKRQRMSARLPPAEDVADAFRRFFRKKQLAKERIEDNQAQLALRSLQYCMAAQEYQTDFDAAANPYITSSDLGIAAWVLSINANLSTDDHVNLAKAIYEAPESPRLNWDSRSPLRAYVGALCWVGSPDKAQDVVLEYEKKMSGETLQVGAQTEAIEAIEAEEDAEGCLRDNNKASDHQHRNLAFIWASVLEGIAKTGDEGALQRTLGFIHERGLHHLARVPQTMLNFHLSSNDDLQTIKYWWTQVRRLQLGAKKTPARMSKRMGNDLHNLLNWCLTHGEVEMGHDIVKEVMTSNPPKHVWDAILVWAAGTKRSVDEIDRMMTIMEKSNETVSDRSEWRAPDIATINDLVEFAISRDDPYMAERFITLGKERNIEPDAKTFVLQMDYRLSVDDVDGALIAYKNLQSKDVSNNEDVSTVNRLIVALCKTNRHDFDTIMNVAADLSDRRVRFDSSAVSALSLLHLSRDEHHDVVDLLNTHAYHYSSTERDSIRKALMDFCTDTKIPTSRAWVAYGILKDVFDEMPRTERTDLMTSFLNRERADMAVRIFQNMRMHSRADTIPTIDTYVTAFVGLAKLRDLDSVEVIHNQLKLDFNINVNTYLNNALVLAYTACGEARHALDFWQDIVASKEGPSYNSLHVALRACEKAAFGDMRAKEIWTMLRRRGVELDQSLWASYAAALAGNGDVGLSISTLEEAEAKDDLDVDYFILGSLFNSAQRFMKGEEVKRWGAMRYPEAWEKLEGFGVEIEEQQIEGYTVPGILKGYKIDRRVGP